MRKEREEKGLGRAGQTVKNVGMRSTEFSQSPNDHLKAGSSGARSSGSAEKPESSQAQPGTESKFPPF